MRNGLLRTIAAGLCLTVMPTVVRSQTEKVAKPTDKPPAKQPAQSAPKQTTQPAATTNQTNTATTANKTGTNTNSTVNTSSGTVHHAVHSPTLELLKNSQPDAGVGAPNSSVKNDGARPRQ